MGLVPRAVPPPAVPPVVSHFERLADLQPDSGNWTPPRGCRGPTAMGTSLVAQHAVGGEVPARFLRPQVRQEHEMDCATRHGDPFNTHRRGRAHLYWHQ